MLYQTSYLNHAARMRRAAAACGMTAHMNLEDFRLVVADETRKRRWYPRFVGVEEGGRFAYSDHLRPTTTGFIGWLPYPFKMWETATDKLAFKVFAADHGIPTPAACLHPGLLQGPFIVKKTRSSFGMGIRGPFLRFDPALPEHRLESGEFYENFIPGHIVKAYYWGGQLGAVDIRTLPAVVGNGSASLRQLIEAVPRKSAARALDWPALNALARFCGLDSVDAVPGTGMQILIDFKYGSAFEPLRTTNRNQLHELADTPLADRLTQAGGLMAGSIGTEEDGRRTLFTLDAMLDPQGTVWFLEMNSNPMVHPDMYDIMLPGSLGEHTEQSPLPRADALSAAT